MGAITSPRPSEPRHWHLRAALAYASWGWYVFPLANGKEPLTMHGVLDASREAMRIWSWWSRWPRANIALACGPSQIVVIDIDPQHGGMETWVQLRRQLDLSDDSVQCLSGGGGLHLYYRAPHNAEVRNSAGLLGPGIDVRGKGGYVVLPPSVHPSGQRYRWEAGHHPEDIPLLPLPQALVERLRQHRTRGAATLSDNDIIPEGQRNLTLTSLGGGMRRQGFSYSAILAALLAENLERCRPPLPESEVRHIASSCARYTPEEKVWAPGRDEVNVSR